MFPSLFKALLLSNLLVSSVLACPAAAAPKSWWKPTLQDSFQMQLDGTVDMTPTVTVYEIDADNTKDTVQKLKAKLPGRRVIAYIDGGSFEKGRSDAKMFPQSVLGNTMTGWPDENWLDIRQLDVLRPIMQARALKAKKAGYDAIDWDNVDGWDQDKGETGFPLSYNDQLAYNKMLVSIAHNLGMAVGLKNNIHQIKDLAPFYDFATNEQCQQYDECDAYKAFTTTGKPVIGLEYENGHDKVCRNAPTKEPHVYVLYKTYDLNASGWDCQLGAKIPT